MPIILGPGRRQRRYDGGGLSRAKLRLGIGAVIAIIALISYCSQRSINPVTGQAQHVALTPEQEVALGLQAAPDMIRQFGGLHPDQAAQATLDRVGNRLLTKGLKRNTPYRFEFHLLADPTTLNAFALPGGQVFITAALYSKLETEGQLAGVLAHEIGHVIERHGAERLAKQNLTAGLAGAVGAATYDPANPASRSGEIVARAIGGLITMKYGREDELESDDWGVRLGAAAGYDPRGMIRVMEILAEASGGNRQAEFFSTHPNPDNRIDRIKAAISREFPGGVPDGLDP